MADFDKILKSPDLPANLRTIYEIIDSRKKDSVVLDSKDPIRHTVDEIHKIQEALIAEVERGRALDSVASVSLDEYRQTVQKNINVIADGFFNPVSGIGTSIDPGSFNQAFTPISMSPNDVTSYYASGGVPARIIDLKTNGVMVNGYQFTSNDWSKEDLEELHVYAESMLFSKALQDSIRDGLLYGGSLFVPTLKKDNALTYQMTLEELVQNKILKKDSIKHFWSADRWNAVLIPDYNISASDYLTPKEMYVPITGLLIRTERAALLRPKMLPYWGTIRQVGWGISDMEGWIKSVLAYEMCIESIPIMSQQMSLMYRHIPIDGLIAQNGPDFAEQFATQQARALTSWSNNSPRTFNSIGEIKVIERNFQGFESLVQILRQDIGAQSSISDSILFNTQATGFSDNEEDVTLKQAQVIKTLGNHIAPQLTPMVKVLIYSCFGPNSPQAKTADSVRISFDSPTVLTNKERNEAGITFSGVVTAMIGGGAHIGDAVQLAHDFTPDIKLTQEVMDRLTEMAALPMEESQGTGEGVQAILEKIGLGQTGTEHAMELLGKNEHGTDKLLEMTGMKEPEQTPVQKILGDIGKSSKGSGVNWLSKLFGKKE